MIARWVEGVVNLSTERLLMVRAQVFAVLFVAYGLAAVLSLALLMPPFGNPDEATHLMRADMISSGNIVGTRHGVRSAGGPIDWAILDAYDPFDLVMYHPGSPVTRALADASHRVKWSSSRSYRYFANTVLYPPSGYIPAVTAIWIGRAADLGVDTTLILARCMGGFIAIAIVAAAIALAGAAAPFLFALLTLPIAMAQTAAVSPDGIIFALAALAMALAWPDLAERTLTSTARAVSITTCLGLVVMARPVYLPLAVVPLLLRGPSCAARCWLTLAIVGVTLAWSALMAAVVMVPLYNGDVAGTPDPSLQMRLLFAHPGMIIQIARATLSAYGNVLLTQFIGAGEWELPHSYFAPAWAILGIALLLSIPSKRSDFASQRALILLAALAAGAVLIFSIQYLTWTRPGGERIDGVQGRYFIPLVIFVPLLLPRLRLRLRLRLRMASAETIAAGVVAIFPAVSLAVLAHAIVWRFYLH